MASVVGRPETVNCKWQRCGRETDDAVEPDECDFAFCFIILFFLFFTCARAGWLVLNAWSWYWTEAVAAFSLVKFVMAAFNFEDARKIFQVVSLCLMVWAFFLCVKKRFCLSLWRMPSLQLWPSMFLWWLIVWSQCSSRCSLREFNLVCAVSLRDSAYFFLFLFQGSGQEACMRPSYPRQVSWGVARFQHSGLWKTAAPERGECGCGSVLASAAGTASHGRFWHPSPGQVWGDLLHGGEQSFHLEAGTFLQFEQEHPAEALQRWDL